MAEIRALSILFALLVLDLQSTSSEAPPINTEKMPSLVKEIEDNSRYKTLEANATLMKLLVDSKDGVSRSEVFDMLNSRGGAGAEPGFPEDAGDARAGLASLRLPDAQAEYLQGPEVVVEKDYPGSRGARASAGAGGGAGVGTAAGLMLLMTCGIMCLAYTTFMVSRRMYLQRNGLKHERLRNEENIAETRIEL